ncbi:MAG: hypothetical protein ACRCVT_15540 [Leadbetterella sp.]
MAQILENDELRKLSPKEFTDYKSNKLKGFVLLSEDEEIEFIVARLTDDQNSKLKLWVEVLKENKYLQAKGSLKKGNSFCCLGVACDIYKKEVNGKWLKGDFIISLDDGKVKSKNSQALPDDVYKLLGFNANVPKISKKIAAQICAEFELTSTYNINLKRWYEDGGSKVSKYFSIAALNDIFDFSFPMIARALELQYEL